MVPKGVRSRKLIPKIMRKGIKVIKNNQPIKTRAVSGIGLDDLSGVFKTLLIPYEFEILSKIASSVLQVR